ncbi:8-oxo-dGTP pyrophosphatase MutT (NUDIX family) [Oxalobacteraceae bacterium GrIS 1.11]
MSENLPKHFTASGFVLTRNRKILLIEHRKLGVWLYPGGHLEANATPDAAVIREIYEETGIRAEILGAPDASLMDRAADVTALHTPYQILCERINDKCEPHYHLDLSYLCQARNDDCDEVIRDAEPLSDVSGFRIPGSVRRHYERAPTWPDGLLVIGAWIDGRSHACAIQCLLAQVVQPAWDMAVGEDLRFPETLGERSLATRLRHWYGAGLVRLSASDLLALQIQIGVSNLVLEPKQLYRPEIAGRILWNSFIKHPY